MLNVALDCDLQLTQWDFTSSDRREQLICIAKLQLRCQFFEILPALAQALQFFIEQGTTMRNRLSNMLDVELMTNLGTGMVAFEKAQLLVQPVT